MLHGLMAAALYLSLPGVLPVALPLLLVHGWLRRPACHDVLIVTDGEHFSLPLDNRFGLRLTAASGSGPGWISLVFRDRPLSQLLVLRDQVDAAGWRRLRLALGNSD
jgi:hypothetical protein